MSAIFSSIFSRQLHSFYRPGLAQVTLSRNLSKSPFSKPVFPLSSTSRSFSSSSKFFGEAQLGSVKARSTQRTASIPWLYKAAGVAGVGLGLSVFSIPKVFCEPVLPKTPVAHPPPAPSHEPSSASSPPPPPQSSVNYYELTFGTLCGVCAGVFVKKGAKAAAFVLGGVFVLLQYLGSLSLVRVDWERAASRFENLFYTTDSAGAKRAPTIGSLFRWIVDFLTADFQQRASFVAGFALGLRIG